MSEGDGAQPLDRLQRAMDLWLAFTAEHPDGDVEQARAFVDAQDPELQDILRDLIAGSASTDEPSAEFEGEGEAEAGGSGQAPGASGQRVAGYRLVRELGRGGMGTVFEAIDVVAERRVALKILDRGLALTSAGLERFRREAAASARVKHPSIAQLYAVGEDDGMHWIAMELVDGESMSERIAHARLRQDRSIGAARAAQWIADIADALSVVHAEGILHRDLKPTNILIDGESCARLIDFGLAKFLDKSQVSLTAGFAGSLAYASPEQLSGGVELGPPSDIWSLGVVLYECLALRRPFGASTTEGLIREITHVDATAPDAPGDLRTICLKCLEKEPGRRYASAAALAQDLRRFLAHEPISASPPGTVSRVMRFVRRRRSATVATLCALALLGVLWLFFEYRSSSRATLRDAVSGAESTLRSLVLLDSGTRRMRGSIGDLRKRVEAHVREAERLQELRPGDQRLRVLLALTHERAAQIYQKINLEQQAFRAHERARALCEVVLADEPNDFAARNLLASSYHNQHVYERALGRQEAASAHLKIAISTWQGSVQLFEKEGGERRAWVEAKGALASAWNNRAMSSLRLERADRDLERAQKIWDELRAQKRMRPIDLVESLRTIEIAAQRQMHLHDYDASLESTAEVLERAKKASADLGRRSDLRSVLSDTHQLRGRLHRIERRFEESAAEYRRSIELRAALASESKAIDDAINLLAVEFGYCALLDETNNRAESTRALLETALRRAESLLERAPEHAKLRGLDAKLRALFAYDAWRRKLEASVVRSRFEAAIGTTRLVARDLATRNARLDLARVVGSFGVWLVSQKAYAQAVEALREGMGILEACFEENGKAGAASPVVRDYRVQARSLCRALWLLKEGDALERAARRIHAAQGSDVLVFANALLALDGSIRFQRGGNRSRYSQKIAALALSWIRQADRAGLAWRKSTRVRYVELLRKHRELGPLFRSPPK